MESHGIRVAAVEDVSVFIFRAQIINPLSNKFITQFLPQIIPITEERQAVLGEIKNHFKSHSKEHYLRKCIIPIGDSEIPEVKECKLNICTLCFGHCSKRHINEHLKKAHHINNKFLQHTLATSGYVIPNQNRTMSYLYRRTVFSAEPIDMFDLGSSAPKDNSEDKFLRYIHAEDYEGKGYAQYLAGENEMESGPVIAAVEMESAMSLLKLFSKLILNLYPAIGSKRDKSIQKSEAWACLLLRSHKPKQISK